MKKKKLDTKKVMVYFIAFIMISSIFGIIFSGYRQQTVSMEYNGYTFLRQDNKWVMNLNNNLVSFDYYPEEVESLNISPEIVSMLTNTFEIDATSEPNSTYKDTIAVVEYEMINFLSDNVNLYLRTGFTEENDYGLPIITCADSTPRVPVIYFKKSNITKVSLDRYCVVAEARDDFGFLRIKDRLLYTILGIIG
ncbi:MAG: hypothetical protein ABIC04_08555 [Nanoarchaeota archaeon]